MIYFLNFYLLTKNKDLIKTKMKTGMQENFCEIAPNAVMTFKVLFISLISFVRNQVVGKKKKDLLPR